jgi:hypothetical protein
MRMMDAPRSQIEKIKLWISEVEEKNPWSVRIGIFFVIILLLLIGIKRGSILIILSPILLLCFLRDHNEN